MMSGDADKSVSYYKKDINPIPEPARELLESYSGIPADEVEAHISRLVSYNINRIGHVVGWKKIAIGVEAPLFHSLFINPPHSQFSHH